MMLMAVGRPIEFDPEQALDDAVRVFWTKGFEATSTQDLLEAMGLSKSSLYQTFGSKKELFMRCLDRYCAFTGERERQSLNGRPPDISFLKDLLRGLGDPDRYPSDPRGCLMVNSTIELGKRDEQVSEFVNKKVAMTLDMFEGVIRRAQAAGELSSGQDPKALAGMVVMSVHGLKAMSRLDVGHDVLEPAVQEIINKLN